MNTVSHLLLLFRVLFVEFFKYIDFKFGGLPIFLHIFYDFKGDQRPSEKISEKLVHVTSWENVILVCGIRLT